MTTNINIGDIFNPTGAVPKVGTWQVDPMKFLAGGNTAAPIDLRTTSLKQMMGGFASGQFANDPNYPGYAAWSGLPGNGYTSAFANGDLLRGGGARNTITNNADGSLTMQPVLMNTRELTSVARSNPPATNSPTVNGSAFNTFPYFLTPPFAVGVTALFPADMSNQSGEWPATWFLDVGLGWPPEGDTQDGYNGGPGQVTFNAGFIWSSAGGGGSSNQSQFPYTPGKPVTLLCVVYTDKIAFFAGNQGDPLKCTGVQPTPTNFQTMRAYAIWNFATKSEASWPNAVPVNRSTWSPMTIQALHFFAMPAAYPGPANSTIPLPLLAGPVVPTPTPTPVPTPTPTPTPPVPTPTPTPTPVSVPLTTLTAQAMTQADAYYKMALVNTTAAGPLWTKLRATLTAIQKAVG